ncbi:MAG: NUDIX domain-containing protein, partial [Ilumatobacteraceae bacterium]
MSEIYRRSGDGFMLCSDGNVRWGVFGAAGVVFVCDSSEGRLAMVQRRSAFAHEGGTWSCAGGALDEGESPLEGGLREASEEVGAVPQQYEVLGEV